MLALASFMLLPANLLPITHFYNKGLLQSDTIFSGIMMLYRSKMSGIATIVLTASIIVPVGKILGWAGSAGNCSEPSRCAANASW